MADFQYSSYKTLPLTRPCSVFVVSTVVGFLYQLQPRQIRDILATATRARSEYRAVMDATQNYLHKLNLPVSLQDRIKLWFTYTWQSQKTLSKWGFEVGQCEKTLNVCLRTSV